MSDRQAEQATREQVRGLVMADVRGGAELRPVALDYWIANHVPEPVMSSHDMARAPGLCPGCGRGGGLWCAPWCEYADPAEPCPDCDSGQTCHPWCPRREEAPS